MSLIDRITKKITHDESGKLGSCIKPDAKFYKLQN